MKIGHSLNRAVLVALGLVAAIGPSARAGLLVTIEQPGVQSSMVPGVTTEGFDSLATGNHTSYVSPIGTYSGQFAIVSPNAYGGSNASQYLAIGAQSGSTETTLTLNERSAYFGMYWSAGDGLNQLDFYDGVDLVRSFRTADVISYLNGTGNSSAYYGNPNNGEDSWEPFAYLNFFGQDGTKFDRIVFRNDSTGTGFETDNHSVCVAEVEEPCGSPVPEPASAAMAAIAAAAVSAVLIRRRRPAES